jgi:hypothetical protein
MPYSCTDRGDAAAVDPVASGARTTANAAGEIACTPALGADIAVLSDASAVETKRFRSLARWKRTSGCVGATFADAP